MLTKNLDVTGEEAFFLHLSQAWTQTQKFMERALGEAGVTIAEYTLLRIIENTPGITAGEARGRLYATAPSVAQLVAQCERKGFITRGRDSTDARRLPLRLAPRGKKALQNAKRAVSQLLSRLKLPSGLLDSLTRNLSIFLTSLPPYGAQ